jgi:hypothetical protein
MSAMPAVQWPEMDHKEPQAILARREIDHLIIKVTAYRELVQDYPVTMVYRSLLEEAEMELKEAEKKYLRT